jgi:DNA-binding transcriptional MerR regulator
VTAPLDSYTAADRAGITYRQLDWWCRQGYVHAPSGGSGYRRTIPAHEMQVLQRMGRLVKTGLAVNVAAQAARFMTDRELAYAPLTGGVVIWIREGL